MAAAAMPEKQGRVRRRGRWVVVRILDRGMAGDMVGLAMVDDKVTRERAGGMALQSRFQEMADDKERFGGR